MKKTTKILSIALSVTMAFSLVCTSSALETDDIQSSAVAKTVYGDVDHNGYVSTADAIKLMNHAIGKNTIPSANLTAADMSSDPSMNDAIAVMKISQSGDPVRVTGAKVSASKKTLVVGGSLSLGAYVTPTNATNKYFSYTSSKTSVATVNSNGKVTAKAAGTATITARSVDGGYTAKCTVTVNDPQPSNTVKYNGADYRVCDNYSTKYFYDQCDYSKFNEGGSNVGCSATAEAIGASMYYGKRIAPDDSKIIWTSWGAGFGLANVRYYNNSLSDKLTIAYNQLKKGNPTIINTVGAYSDHWVTIVGVKSGANASNLKTSDFLIVNPWGGVLDNLGTYLSNAGRSIPYSYSIRAYE